MLRAMTHGGDIIADVLARHGVTHLFTLCGGHISPILTVAQNRGIRVIDVRDEANAQAQYDKETDHGRRAAEQVRWDKEVDGQLFSTSKFTLPGNGKTPGV